MRWRRPCQPQHGQAVTDRAALLAARAWWSIVSFPAPPAALDWALQVKEAAAEAGMACYRLVGNRDVEHLVRRGEGKLI